MVRVRIVPTQIFDPMFAEGVTRVSPTVAQPRGYEGLDTAPEDDKCPICHKLDCNDHLLAGFDEDLGEGNFGLGLVGGPLCEGEEIENLVSLIHRAWLKKESLEKDRTPKWIREDGSLYSYYYAIECENESSLSDFKDIDDAVNEAEFWVPSYEARDLVREFLRRHRCGWDGLETQEEYEVPLRSTTYYYFWTKNPTDVAEKFRKVVKQKIAEALAEEK